MKWYMIPLTEYVDKKRWNSRSGFVNANPVRLNDHFFGIPEDFLSEEVLNGSRENEDSRALIESFQLSQDAPIQPKLHELITKSIVSRIAGKTPAISKPIFSVKNHSEKIYVRNKENWCYGVNLTCVSPWNSQIANQGGGVLITKRHMLTAAHFAISPGFNVRFVSNNNEVIERTIVSALSHPDFVPNYPDFRVYTLNEDVPDSIAPCKILSPDWEDYLQDVPSNTPLVLAMDQEQKALVFECYDMHYQDDKYCRFRHPSTASHRLFYEGPVSGDSGQPYFYIINNEPVLLGCLTGSVVTFLSNHITDLNQMIEDCDALAGVSTGYTVVTNDLTGFPIL